MAAVADAQVNKQGGRQLGLGTAAAHAAEAAVPSTAKPTVGPHAEELCWG